MKPSAILHVEDDEVDAISLQRALHKLECEIPLFRAENGQQALDLITGTTSIFNPNAVQLPSPLLIFLDLNLPLMNGKDFISNIAKLNLHIDYEIYILSTSKRCDDLKLENEINVVGYILKEQQDQELRSLLRERCA
jgi:CheY-like chemotaxis protein